jgi:gliding motility-associated-like protein
LLPGFDVFSYQFQIYNRWGELVFSSQDVNFGWDGTYGPGALQAQQGVYIWKMTYRDQTTNQRKELVGHVNLIR